MQESGEMYLETIYRLSLQDKPVHSVDVAMALAFSKPSVSRAISLLRKQALVEADHGGELRLTEDGLNRAKRIYERHTIITDVLMKIGVDEKTASEDACRIEHYISEATFEALKSHAGAL